MRANYGGTYDSRSLYFLLVSEKMDKLSKKKVGGFLTNSCVRVGGGGE
jgi:hypothetical protein